MNKLIQCAPLLFALSATTPGCKKNEEYDRSIVVRTPNGEIIVKEDLSLLINKRILDQIAEMEKLDKIIEQQNLQIHNTRVDIAALNGLIGVKNIALKSAEARLKLVEKEMQKMLKDIDSIDKIADFPDYVEGDILSNTIHSRALFDDSVVNKNYDFLVNLMKTLKKRGADSVNFNHNVARITELLLRLSATRLGTYDAWDEFKEYFYDIMALMSEEERGKVLYKIIMDKDSFFRKYSYSRIQTRDERMGGIYVFEYSGCTDDFQQIHFFITMEFLKINIYNPLILKKVYDEHLKSFVNGTGSSGCGKTAEKYIHYYIEAIGEK